MSSDDLWAMVSTLAAVVGVHIHAASRKLGGRRRSGFAGGNVQVLRCLFYRHLCF